MHKTDLGLEFFLFFFNGGAPDVAGLLMQVTNFCVLSPAGSAPQPAAPSAPAPDSGQSAPAAPSPGRPPPPPLPPSVSRAPPDSEMREGTHAMLNDFTMTAPRSRAPL